MKRIIYFLFIMFFAAGCYYDIDVYHNPDFTPHLAVFSYIEAGKPFSVFVSKSDYPGEVDSNDILTDAQVEIETENGQKLLPDSSGRGYYYFSPINDGNFKISVKAINMESNAQVSFPPVVDLPEISVMPYDVSIAPDQNQIYYLSYSFKMDVKIADNSEYENVYGIYLFSKNPEFYYDTVNYVQTDSLIGYNDQEVWFSLDDLSTSNYTYVDIPDGEFDILVFNDGILNGKTIMVSLDGSSNKQVKGQPQTDTLYCIYYSFSPDLFKYAKSLDRYYDTRNNPFVEPVDIYSNFSQGIGLATAYRIIDTIAITVELQQ